MSARQAKRSAARRERGGPHQVLHQPTLIRPFGPPSPNGRRNLSSPQRRDGPGLLRCCPERRRYGRGKPGLRDQFGYRGVRTGSGWEQHRGGLSVGDLVWSGVDQADRSETYSLVETGQDRTPREVEGFGRRANILQHGCQPLRVVLRNQLLPLRREAYHAFRGGIEPSQHDGSEPPLLEKGAR